MRPPAKNVTVCYVTDRKSLTGMATEASAARMLQNIHSAVAAGVDWVQIREKDLSAGQLVELARRAIRLTRERARESERPARVIINDRLDVALAAQADGVHLGGESAPAPDVVRWCRAGNAPPNFVIGVSCHSVAEAREAEKAKADYIFFGPVFETPSKQAFGIPQGMERLAEVCSSVNIAVVAIGGVNQENAPACIRAGAVGIGAIRIFQESGDEDAISGFVASVHGLRAEKA